MKIKSNDETVKSQLLEETKEIIREAKSAKLEHNQRKRTLINEIIQTNIDLSHKLGNKNKSQLQNIPILDLQLMRNQLSVEQFTKKCAKESKNNSTKITPDKQVPHKQQSSPLQQAFQKQHTQSPVAHQKQDGVTNSPYYPNQYRENISTMGSSAKLDQNSRDVYNPPEPKREGTNQINVNEQTRNMYVARLKIHIMNNSVNVGYITQQ